MRTAGKILRFMADHLDPPTPMPRVDGPQRIPTLDKSTVFTRDERLDGERRENALAMMDDDLLGYVLVRARRVGAVATMELGIALEDWLWPAMSETLGRIVLEAGRVHAS